MFCAEHTDISLIHKLAPYRINKWHGCLIYNDHETESGRNYFVSVDGASAPIRLLFCVRTLYTKREYHIKYYVLCFIAPK